MNTATAELSKASLDSVNQWPPSYLPAELLTIATTADLIRHENDRLYDGAEGVCLGVSGFISMLLLEADIPHKLANGFYTDGNGENKPHWWIETPSGWILDASRGQFHHTDGLWRSSVTQRTDTAYKLRASWDPGHSSLDLVVNELKDCFTDPYEAEYYLDICLEIQEESVRLTGA